MVSKNIIPPDLTTDDLKGVFSLWNGLSASYLRQSFYSTARFGLNSYFVDKAKKYTGQQKLSSFWEILCAGASGGAAGMIGNPTEVWLLLPTITV